MLVQSSLNYRKNLWSMLVRPLFEFTLAIYEIEPAETRRLQFQRLLKRTFKDFTLLSKTTPDRTILALCGYELNSRAKEVSLRERKKWKLRLLRTSGRDFPNSGEPVLSKEERHKKETADLC